MRRTAGCGRPWRSCSPSKQARCRPRTRAIPDGRHLTGRPPTSLRGGHFGPELVSYILYQHHHCLVTQPLLHEQLREWGIGEWAIEISAVQIDALGNKIRQGAIRA